MNNKRNSSIELARVTAMLFVLILHTLVGYDEEPFYNTVLETFLWTCNFMFLMISGEMNLPKVLNSARDTLNFYVRRLVTIMLPLLVTTTVTYAVDVFHYGQKLSLGYLYAAFMDSYSGTHLWFVYMLAGLMLSTPILSKAFRNMDNGELHVIFGTSMAWFIVKYWFAEDLGLDFVFDGWILADSLFYFFAGYYLRRTLTERGKKWLYGLGAVGFLVTAVFAHLFPEEYCGAMEQAPAYVLFTMAFYTFLTREVKLSGVIEKVILFLGRHSFTIYLMHWTMLFVVVTPFVPDYENALLFFTCRFALNFTLCTLGAVVIDNFFLFPLQKKLIKVISR